LDMDSQSNNEIKAEERKDQTETCQPNPSDSTYDFLKKQIDGQASGHAALYQYKPGELLKFSNGHEIRVYQNIQRFENMKKICAQFHGVVEISTSVMEGHTISTRKIKPGSFRDPREVCIFVHLEDLCHPFKKPQVADVKLGKLNYDVDETEQGKQQHIARAIYNGMALHGCRFDGINLNTESGKELVLRKRELWANSLENNFIGYLFPKFFDPEEAKPPSHDRWDFMSCENRRDRVKILVDTLIVKLKFIEETLNDQIQNFNFLQGSLLFLYEGDVSAPPLVDVRVIDFDRAHYRNEEGIAQAAAGPQEDLGDVGAAFGVESMLKILTDLQKSLSS